MIANFVPKDMITGLIAIIEKLVLKIIEIMGLIKQQVRNFR